MGSWLATWPFILVCVFGVISNPYVDGEKTSATIGLLVIVWMFIIEWTKLGLIEFFYGEIFLLKVVDIDLPHSSVEIFEVSNYECSAKITFTTYYSFSGCNFNIGS